MAAFGNRTLDEMIKIKLNHKASPDVKESGVLYEKETTKMQESRGKPCKVTARRQPSASQEECRRNQISQHPELGLLASRTVRRVTPCC